MEEARDNAQGKVRSKHHNEEGEERKRQNETPNSDGADSLNQQVVLPLSQESKL